MPSTKCLQLRRWEQEAGGAWEGFREGEALTNSGRCAVVYKANEERPCEVKACRGEVFRTVMEQAGLEICRERAKNELKPRELWLVQ